MLNLFIKQSVSLSLSLCTCMFVSECSCLSLFGGTLASPFLFYTIGVETLFLCSGWLLWWLLRLFYFKEEELMLQSLP